MKLEEYLQELEKEPFKNALPAYMTAEDISENLVKIRGEWYAIPDIWGVIKKDGKYIYFRTANDEKGYIWNTEEREDEDSLVEYIKKEFDLELAVAAAGPDTEEDMMRRFLVQDYEYTEKDAINIVKRLHTQDDIYVEFLKFMIFGKFRILGHIKGRYDGMTAELYSVVEGYTAEKLVKKYDYTEPEAALMMIELRENPEEAKKKLLRRFVRMKYGYSEADAANAVERISKHEDIFAEFYEFARSGEMERVIEWNGALKVAKVNIFVETAEELVREFHMTELEAYLFMVEKIENPKEARIRYDKLRGFSE